MYSSAGIKRKYKHIQKVFVDEIDRSVPRCLVMLSSGSRDRIFYHIHKPMIGSNYALPAG